MTENETADPTPEVEATESWLLTLAREFGSTVKRSKNGINLVADAACEAANTTRTIAKNTTETISKKISAFPKRDHTLSSSEEALFEELGSKVAQCPGDDYLALKNDLEFWGLIKQLHSIRGKVAKGVVAEEESRQDEQDGQDEIRDSSQENSESAEEESRQDEQDGQDETNEEDKVGEPPTEG